MHMHCSERTWHIWAIASVMRAQTRQGEVGEVDRVQTESCLGVHDIRVQLYLDCFNELGRILN